MEMINKSKEFLAICILLNEWLTPEDFEKIIEELPAIVAISYACANLDGNISDSEEIIINKYINDCYKKSKFNKVGKETTEKIDSLVSVSYPLLGQYEKKFSVLRNLQNIEKNSSVSTNLESEKKSSLSVYINDLYNELSIKPQDAIKKIEQTLEEIRSKKESILLSEALEYVTPKVEKRIRKSIKTIIDEIIDSDDKIDLYENVFLDRLNIFIKEGKSKSIEKITELEDEEEIVCYFLTNQKNYRTRVKTAKILSPQSKEFTNLSSLIENDYYIAHPIVSNQLFRILDLDKIDKFIIIEWQSLARKLGAKKFTATTIKNTEIQNETSFFSRINASMPTIPISSNVELNKESSLAEIKKRFEAFNATWTGSECVYTKEELLNNLCWLKYDIQAKELIESIFSNNKQESYNYNFNFSEFKRSNKSLNMSVAINVASKIDADASSKISSTITESSKYKQIIEIYF